MLSMSPEKEKEKKDQKKKLEKEKENKEKFRNNGTVPRQQRQKLDTRKVYMRILWTLNLYSLNKTTSIASAQSNCNIVGVEHKDGYYFQNNTLLTILF